MTTLTASAAAWAVLAAGPCAAAIIHSNGGGGGLWSEPDTWHGGAAPEAQDTVVIAVNDIVVFDRRDTTGPTCRDIFIDPGGVLTFKRSDREFALTVDGSIESYGAIKINATDLSRGVFELRIVTKPGEQRGIRLLKHGALLAYGYKQFRDRRRNVRITAVSPDNQQRAAATVIANGQAMIDLNHTTLTDVVVHAESLDNTGSKGYERINVVGNLFFGLARLELVRCDTPAIRNNFFDSKDVKINEPAISVTTSKLADIKENYVNGQYAEGIHVSHDVSSLASGNVIKGCKNGLYWRGGDGMIQGNLVTDSHYGVRLDQISGGVIENVVVRKTDRAFTLEHVTMQMTSCWAEEVPDDGWALHVGNFTSVSLLNCDFAFDRIVTAAPPYRGDGAQTMHYMVVKVTGDVPSGTRVIVRTAEVSGGVPEGKGDLNVRNSPARLDAHGFTPLPGTKKSLIVRGWSIPLDRKKRQAPFYEIIVLEPSAAADLPPKVVATKIIEPDDSWFRAEPDQPTPTVEIDLP